MMNRASLVLTGHDIFRDCPSRSGVDANIAASVGAAMRVIDELQKDGFQFVRPDQFLEGRRRGGLALLTFDDAYRSVNDLLIPFLRARNIPLTIFVISEALTQERDPFPVWLLGLRDAGERAAEDAFQPLRESLPIQRTLAAVKIHSLQELFAKPLGFVVESFREHITPAELAGIGRLIVSIAPELRLTMNKAELERMMDLGGVTLGAHSRTHRSFPMLSNDEVTAEIVESTKEIAAFVGLAPKSIPFAYPFGAVTTHAQQVVGKHCSAGFTCHNRALSVLDPRTALPRINMDGRALSVARSGNGCVRALSFAHETLRRQVRLGPAWTLLGPLYLGMRQAHAKWKRMTGSQSHPSS